MISWLSGHPWMDFSSFPGIAKSLAIRKRPCAMLPEICGWACMQQRGSTLPDARDDACLAGILAGMRKFRMSCPVVSLVPRSTTGYRGIRVIRMTGSAEP